MSKAPNITRDVQRSELHKTIWSIAEDLRGSVDGWNFNYAVLTDEDRILIVKEGGVV